MSDATFGALCATASALTWALTNLVVRSLSGMYNSVALNAMRSAAGGALIVAWIAFGAGPGGLATMSTAAWVLLAMSVVLAVGVGDTAFFESTRWLGLARAMTVAMTYPILSALLAAAALGERLRWPVLLGAVITLSGVVLTVRARTEGAPESLHARLGLGAALLASIAWAVGVVMMKPALDEVDPVRAQAVRLPVAAIVLGLTPWAWRRPPAVVPRGPTPLVRLGVLGALTALSSVTFVAGLRHAGVAVATVLSSTAPIFALPLGILFLGERPSALAVAGTLLAVAGVAVLQQ